jgi:hypothetical protein
MPKVFKNLSPETEEKSVSLGRRIKALGSEPKAVWRESLLPAIEE